MNQPSQAGRSEMRLYDHCNRRLYVNTAERTRFLAATERFPLPERTFALTLLYTGCRISEALQLTPSDIQLHARLITFRTLKQRHQHRVREVPIPVKLITCLEQCHRISDDPGSRHPLWQRNQRPLARADAYRWIKAIMAEAGIVGAQACPKGLRHGYGIHATLSGVQLHMLSKWMGHASLATTQIYANACGPEEQEIASRMWQAQAGDTGVGSGPLSAADQRILARAYDRRLGNPPCRREAPGGLHQEGGIGSGLHTCFENERYFAVALADSGQAALLIIDREMEHIVGSIDVTVRASG